MRAREAQLFPGSWRLRHSDPSTPVCQLLPQLLMNPALGKMGAQKATAPSLYYLLVYARWPPPKSPAGPLLTPQPAPG